MRPSQVAPLVDISPRTAYRYFEDWKKGPRHQELVYQTLRAALKGGGVPPEQFVEALAAALHLSHERVMGELQKAWGLKRLLSGRPHHLDKTGIRRLTLARLDAALRLVHLYEARGIAPERIVEELNRLKDQREASGQAVAPGDTGQAG